jgi:hypothetical protein
MIGEMGKRMRCGDIYEMKSNLLRFLDGNCCGD